MYIDTNPLYFFTIAIDVQCVIIQYMDHNQHRRRPNQSALPPPKMPPASTWVWPFFNTR